MKQKQKPLEADGGPMSSYLVVLKSYAEKTIAAYGYTEDPQTGRIYFHKKKDKSDKNTFFLAPWLIAIIEMPKDDEADEF